jgi:glycine C-acetyltransferase
VYKHADMDDLRAKLAENKGAKRRVIWTDGVFSMEGAIAKLPDILQIARDTNSIVAMDDSHSTGVLGKTGRGTAEHFGVFGEVDVITSTLGKALGGAAGGFVAGSAALCDYLMQRARPQLFSNALPTTVAASAMQAVRYLEAHPELVDKLRSNTKYFRDQIQGLGFKPLPGETPIVPIIVGETSAAIQMSNMLLDEGVFVTGFGFPVVPKGEARVRCQISAGHSTADLDTAIAAFKTVGRKLKLI